MISSVSTNDVRRFLLCMRVYSTVAVQGTCTFLLCLGLVLAFPHLKSTVFLGDRGQRLLLLYAGDLLGPLGLRAF